RCFFRNAPLPQREPVVGVLPCHAAVAEPVPPTTGAADCCYGRSGRASRRRWRWPSPIVMIYAPPHSEAIPAADRCPVDRTGTARSLPPAPPAVQAPSAAPGAIGLCGRCRLAAGQTKKRPLASARGEAAGTGEPCDRAAWALASQGKRPWTSKA